MSIVSDTVFTMSPQDVDHNVNHTDSDTERISTPSQHQVSATYAQDDSDAASSMSISVDSASDDEPDPSLQNTDLNTDHTDSDTAHVSTPSQHQTPATYAQDASGIPSNMAVSGDSASDNESAQTTKPQKTLTQGTSNVIVETNKVRYDLFIPDNPAHNRDLKTLRDTTM
ncbi:hypothetical protein DFQ27_004965 [Actinomortierella ambigua]|uniref:Uncharacterized protein n=1 Tax=Actinomortierella ambigua TaxID=1343610 RepID=A0A9P6QM75_9FUNG|nr:hypothetical protein DFQ27_004965 [Actinomortierella ambigua]